MSALSIPTPATAPSVSTSRADRKIAPTDTSPTLHDEGPPYTLTERVKDFMWDHQVVMNTFIAGESTSAQASHRHVTSVSSNGIEALIPSQEAWRAPRAVRSSPR